MDLTAEAIKVLLGQGKIVAQEAIVLPNNQVGLIVPQGYEVQTFSDPYQLPDHISALVRLSSGNSFIDYVNTYKNDRTRIMASRGTGRFVAHFDYHTPAGPSHNRHSAMFDLPLSREWVDWTGAEARPFTQEGFADFIEDQKLSIIKPDSASLLELITQLEAKSSANFQSSIRRDNGSFVLSYVEENNVQAKGGIAIPSVFEIGIPVYQDDNPYKLEVNLRTKVRSQVVSFTVKLVQAEKVKEAAFNAIREVIQNGTSITIWDGSL